MAVKVEKSLWFRLQPLVLQHEIFQVDFATDLEILVLPAWSVGSDYFLSCVFYLASAKRMVPESF
jgi:hypothetical protein